MYSMLFYLPKIAKKKKKKRIEKKKLPQFHQTDKKWHSSSQSGFNIRIHKGHDKPKDSYSCILRR